MNAYFFNTKAFIKVSMAIPFSIALVGVINVKCRFYFYKKKTQWPNCFG